jgi:hypothetical protein
MKKSKLVPCVFLTCLLLLFVLSFFFFLAAIRKSEGLYSSPQKSVQSF